MKYIVIILVVVVIIHDISIYRLQRKVDAMQTIFEKIGQRVEEYAKRHGYRKREERSE